MTSLDGLNQRDLSGQDGPVVSPPQSGRHATLFPAGGAVAPDAG
jgi:hypothetical protein